MVKIDSKIKQGTSWWETVFLGGSEVGLSNNVLTRFLYCGESYDVILSPYGGGQSAADVCGSGGGSGNKFGLLDITEE